MQQIGFGGRDKENRKCLHMHSYIHNTHPKERKRRWPLQTRVRVPVHMENRMVAGTDNSESRAYVSKLWLCCKLSGDLRPVPLLPYPNVS